MVAKTNGEGWDSDRGEFIPGEREDDWERVIRRCRNGRVCVEVPIVPDSFVVSVPV